MLLLIDGTNILRTIYEANPAQDSIEKVDGAFRSGLSSFRRAIAEHDPDYALAAFDYGGKNWRHELYPPYKEGRKPMYQGLRDRLPEFYGLLEDIGLKTISVPGVEAEDVLATANARWHERKVGPVVALSSDKDVAALVVTGTMVKNHFKNQWHDGVWIEEKFGVAPNQLLDYLALTGDDTDGIPGVKGVGAKTAARLIRQFDNLDGVLRNAALIAGKLGENLRAETEIARLSRKLLELKTDVELQLTWKMLDMRVGQSTTEGNAPVSPLQASTRTAASRP